jgi:hypothetical protein
MLKKLKYFKTQSQTAQLPQLTSKKQTTTECLATATATPPEIPIPELRSARCVLMRRSLNRSMNPTG